MYAPEKDDGNVEYKWKLIDVSSDRIDHLATQMKFRLEEGYGCAFYRLGVSDEGVPLGLPSAQLEETLSNIQKIAARIGASIRVERLLNGRDGKVVELMMEAALAEELHPVESRIVVVGAFESGKSTLVGSLTSGLLDDGSGLSRVRVFRHRHEVIEGHTSSIARQTLGFDENGRVLTMMTPERFHLPYTTSEDSEIIKSCRKLVTLSDLAGHERYIHSTITGLCGSFPDGFLIVDRLVSNDCDLRTYLKIAMGFNVPVTVAITGTDLMGAGVAEKRNKEICAIFEELGLPTRDKEGHCLIVPTSSVNGQGLPELRQILRALPPSSFWISKINDPSAFIVEEIFHEVDGIGLVIWGILLQGVIHQSDVLWCGPFDLPTPKQDAKSKSVKERRTWDDPKQSDSNDDSRPLTGLGVDNLGQSNLGQSRYFSTSDSDPAIGFPGPQADRQIDKEEFPSIQFNRVQQLKSQRATDQEIQRQELGNQNSMRHAHGIHAHDMSHAQSDEKQYWRRVLVKSIQVHRISVQKVTAGQGCSFAIEFLDSTPGPPTPATSTPAPSTAAPSTPASLTSASVTPALSIDGATTSVTETEIKQLRRGMVLTRSLEYAQQTVLTVVKACVTLLPCSRRLEKSGKAKQHVMFFVQCTKQAAVVLSISNDHGTLEPGKTGIVRLQLVHRPHFILPAMQCALWGNGIKAFGAVLPDRGLPGQTQKQRVANSLA